MRGSAIQLGESTPASPAMASPEGRAVAGPCKIPAFPAATAAAGGRAVPAVGLGTASHPFAAEEVAAAVTAALELGYRHLDTAALYGSERLVGEAVAEAVRTAKRGRGVQGGDVRDHQGVVHAVPPGPRAPVRESLQNLRMEYVDLYLVHWLMDVNPSEPHFPMKWEEIVPMDLGGVWKAMEECHRLGLAKMIGVSNFTTKKLRELLAVAKIPPAVNQVELNPSWQQRKLIEFCKDKGIHVTAYSPLGGQSKYRINSVLQSEVLKEIAKTRGKSVAQVSLRWIYEQGASMVTKSIKRERLMENIEIFDWELSDEDQFKISQIPQQKYVAVLGILCPEGISRSHTLSPSCVVPYSEGIKLFGSLQCTIQNFSTFDVSLTIRNVSS